MAERIHLPGDLVSPIAGLLLRRGALVIAEGEPGVVVGISPFRVAWAHYAPCEVAASDVVLDLSDPAGMDLAARWLAAHHGLVVGSTAPGWVASECATGAFEERHDEDGAYSHEVQAPGWVLDVPRWDEFKPCVRRFSSHPLASWFPTPRVDVPGISALIDPAEALRAACLAAVGRTG